MIWNQITQTKLQISQNRLMESIFIPQSSSKPEHPRISCCSVHNSGSDWIGLWAALHWGFTTFISMVRVRERCARSSDGLWALFHALFVWCFPFTDNVHNQDLFSQCHICMIWNNFGHFWVSGSIDSIQTLQSHQCGQPWLATSC